MKVGDFIRQAFENAGAFNEEVDALVGASGLSEFEISDDSVKTFNNNVLTRESAMHDPQILKDIRKDARRHFFNEVDEKIEASLEYILPEDAEIIRNERDTPTKLDLIVPALEKASKAKAPDSSWKDKYNKLEQRLGETQAEYEARMKEMKAEHDDEINQINANFTRKAVDNRIKDEIRSYKLVDEDNIAGGFDFLADGITHRLRNEYGYHLELDENNKDVILRQSVDGTLQDVYNDNEKVTLKKVLDKELDKFIARSPKQESPKPTTNFDEPAPPSYGGTLQEQNMLKAKEKIRQAAASLKE